MGQIVSHRPVLLICAAFSRYPAALDWGKQQAEQAWGPIALASDLFDHQETRYYDASMGTDLKKTFWAFEWLIDPANLPGLKLQTNTLEDFYKQVMDHPEPRPLNLDPGYLTEAKLVLASTKDRDHRIYLRDGIYAEGTLYFHQGAWKTR
ncbi:MAG: DUF4416 family protein, partial [Planctomycetales bacterium]|nr:DUF4416 family protein [Planctomycetales bacterium]